MCRACILRVAAIDMLSCVCSIWAALLLSRRPQQPVGRRGCGCASRDGDAGERDQLPGAGAAA